MRILILDAGFSQTAFLVAEMSRAGIDTVLVSPRQLDPQGLGRYCREIQSPPLEHPEHQSFTEDVLRREAFDAVFATCEPLQQFAWELPPTLTRRVIPAATPLQRRLLASRPELYRLVAALGVPIPREIPLPDERGIVDALAPIGFPCVIRGTQGMSGEQVRICSGVDEALAAYRVIATVSPEPPFAQEFVRGARCLIGGLFSNGRMLQWFSQTSLEVSPAPAGPTIRLLSLKDPVLTEYAERIFRAMEWDGLACAEFIRIGPGDYRFLEINPRPWAAIHAAHTCGVPLLADFCAYLLGREPAVPAAFRAGVECTLFPAFLAARMRNGAFPRVSDVGAYRQALVAAPWSQPALMRSFARQLWWTYSTQRAARLARQASS